MTFGEEDVDAMLARHSADWLYGWLAYSELEPFGPLRDDLRAGVIASMTGNTAFGKKKGSKPITPPDIFVSLRTPAKPQTGEQLTATAKNLTKLFGGVVLKRGEKPPEKADKAAPKLKAKASKSGGKANRKRR